MKKVFKNICMCLLAVVFVCVSAITLTACADEPEEKQVMSVAVNPSIEFVVDEKDKVISVSATNEDCAYILEKYNEFTGMSAKDAALKFLELCEQYGFVVEGMTDGQEITISVSGEGAEQLYNDVKNNIKTKASAIGVSIASLVEINSDELEQIVAECYQEYTASEIGQMSEKELINLIEKSRGETAGLYTEDEKQAYYRERAQEVVKAKLDAVNEYLEQNSSLATTIVSQFVNTMNSAYESIESSYATIESQIEALYTNATTGINSLREKYVAMKADYLETYEQYKLALEQGASNVNDLKAQMETYKTNAETYLGDLEAARDTAISQQMHLIRTTVHNQLASLNSQINSILEYIDLTAENIQTQVNAQIEALKNTYTQSAQNPWGTETPAA